MIPASPTKRCPEGEVFGGAPAPSAGGNKGALAVMVFQGKVTAPVFVTFLQRLLPQVRGTIYLIVEGIPCTTPGMPRA